MSVFKTQDPKYDIMVTVKDGVIDAFLINSASGVGIPEDEPMFIFRAKDLLAIPTLLEYSFKIDAGDATSKSDVHYSAVIDRIAHFKAFKEKYPERMKHPDTAVRMK